MKLLLTTLLCATFIFAGKIQELPQIEVQHTFKNKTQSFTIKREVDPRCHKFHITPDTIYGKTKDEVPDVCKRTAIGVLGFIQKVDIHGVKTIGEIEVLEHIQKTISNPNKYVLTDMRREEWFENLTIPSAINIPYTNIAYDEDFPEDTQKLETTYGITYKDGKYGFENVKTAVMFCNGAWCTQSAKAIKELISIGYPKEKILWYRGGLQEWMNMGFTTIRGDLK
jgi:rhodanese-related sulfurtransferase